MEFLCLIFPFFGFLSTILLSRYINRTLAANLTVIFMGLNVIISFFALQTICISQQTKAISFGTWITSGLLNVGWNFYLDNLTVTMLLLVNFVSFLVHIYSTEYMANDPHLPRFMSYLSLFTFFMVILVTGDNFVILFLGWEGVGLCSYLLISFWHTRVQANKAAMKALIVNRISDFGFTIGMTVIYFVFRSLDFAVVFGLTPLFVGKNVNFCGFFVDPISLIAFLLFFGACGKSAQIGLHTWLPDAMEGPTPVSALIHAATMVTAGVFLIIKCSPIFEFAPKVLTLVTFVGAFTAFFSAICGLVQYDIKKVIAYSTCSQLGYMIFACGLSAYHVSLFHMVNHAFFKALLFLTAGSIIHSLSNEQDLRKYGGLLYVLPFSGIMLLIGSLALMGFPYLSGFYSKDLILEISLATYTLSGAFCYWVGLITAFLTTYYSYRIFYLVFVSKPNAFKNAVGTIHEVPFKMAIALAFLSIGSIFFGYVAKDLFIGLGTDFWNQSIFILPENNHQMNAELLPQTYKILPFIVSLFAVGLANMAFEYNIQINSLVNFVPLHKFLSYKWFFDVVYNKFINFPILIKAYELLFKLLDKGIVEVLGPKGISEIFYTGGMFTKKIQTGFSFTYGCFMLYFLLIFLIIGNFFI